MADFALCTVIQEAFGSTGRLVYRPRLARYARTWHSCVESAADGTPAKAWCLCRVDEWRAPNGLADAQADSDVIILPALRRGQLLGASVAGQISTALLTKWGIDLSEINGSSTFLDCVNALGRRLGNLGFRADDLGPRIGW